MKNLEDMLKNLKQAAETKSMTEYEAIEQMDSIIAYAEEMLKNKYANANEVLEKDIEALVIGKEATYKQVSIRPVIQMNVRCLAFVDYEDGHGETQEHFEDQYCCPKCLKRLTKLLKIGDSHVPSKKVRYCDNCGQKIDWRGEGYQQG